MQFTGEASPPDGAITLWYRQPAADHPYVQPVGAPAIAAATAEWVKALPIGNGRLGAMIFGGVVNERLQLNEDTLWAGGPYNPDNPDAPAALPEVRRLLFAGNYADAAKLITDKVLRNRCARCPTKLSATCSSLSPKRTPWKTIAAISISILPSPTSNTPSTVSTTRANILSSPVDQVIVVHLTASQPGKISASKRK